jgi:hypothetical protein
MDLQHQYLKEPRKMNLELRDESLVNWHSRKQVHGDRMVTSLKHSFSLQITK